MSSRGVTTEHIKKQLVEAMQKSLGVVTSACKLVDVSRTTFYEYYKKDKEFKKACDECGEIALDFAESQLHQQIKDKVPSSTIFYLKTKGKNRGYIERQEHDHTSGGEKIEGIIVFLPKQNEKLEAAPEADTGTNQD